MPITKAQMAFVEMPHRGERVARTMLEKLWAKDQTERIYQRAPPKIEQLLATGAGYQYSQVIDLFRKAALFLVIRRHLKWLEDEESPLVPGPLDSRDLTVPDVHPNEPNVGKGAGPLLDERRTFRGR